MYISMCTQRVRVCKYLFNNESKELPCATRSFTSKCTGVDTTDFVRTNIFSNPMTTMRYGKISLQHWKKQVIIQLHCIYEWPVNNFNDEKVHYLPLNVGLRPNHKHRPTDISSDMTTVITALMAKAHLDFTSSILSTNKHNTKSTMICNPFCLNLADFFFFCKNDQLSYLLFHLLFFY